MLVSKAGISFNISSKDGMNHPLCADNDVCRICLQCNDHNMARISSVAEKFKFVTKLTVQDDDGFPAYICNQCKLKLAIAYGFIKCSISSHNLLQSRLSEGTFQPSQDFATARGETDEEYPTMVMENCAQVHTELCNADEVAIIQVKVEPHETNIEEKPETDPLELYIEHSQLKTYCNVGIVKQDHTYALQTQATATNQAGNPLLSTYQSPPLIDNIEAFSEQSDTEGPLAFLYAVKTEFPAQVDPLLHSDNDNDDDFTNYPPAGSPNPTDDDFEVPVNDEDIGESGRRKMPSKKAQGRTGGKNMLGKKSHPFPCSRCDASFKVKTYLNLHLRSHSPLGKGRADQTERVRNKVEYKIGTLEVSKPFPCPICGKSFVRKRNMTNHIETHPQPVVVLERVTCDMQAQASQDSSESTKLVDTVSDQVHADLNVKQRSKLTCDHCGSCYYKRKQLLRHLRVHFEQERYKCDECKKEFLKKSSLTSHMKCHFHEPIFKCFKCKKKFADKVGLMAHEILRKHGKEAPFDCKYCPKSFKSTFHLKMHRDHFHPLKKCDGCDRKFLDIFQLATHNQVMHSTEYDGLNCFRCKKTFGSKMKLETHLYVSTCRSFFACNKCSITFETKASLKNHLLVHTDDGFICCEICKIMNTSLSKALQMFENQKNLRRHVKRIHSTESFKCRKCGKFFSTQNCLDQHISESCLKQGSLICPTCKGTYSSKSHLDRHLALHANLKPHKCKECIPVFQCPVCPKTFTQKGRLARHTTLNHKNDKTINCSRCDKTFGDKCTMIEHFFKEVCEGPFKCTTCPKSFATQNNLTGHIERMHVKNKHDFQFQCTMCKKSFKNGLWLEKHKYHKHTTRKHVCKTCGAKFASGTSLDKHTNQKDCQSPFQCEVCLKGFFCNQSLKSHLWIHSAKNYPCGQCDKTFKHHKSFSQHQRERHLGANRGSGSHLCDVCGVSYPTLAQLESHAYSHLFVKDHFTCGYCGEEFIDMALLKHHMRLHNCKEKTAMPKPKCMHCAKVFPSHLQLFCHTKRVHNGNRPFACDTCGRSFATMNKIRRHVVSHTKIRLRCNMCTKTTSTKFQMRIHVRKHTGEKPFGCKVCCETFISNYNLKGHVARKHSKNDQDSVTKQGCSMCLKVFKNFASLNKHYKRTHGYYGPPSICEICGFAFRSIRDLSKHAIAGHTLKLPHSCSVCSKTFFNYRLKRKHLLSCHKVDFEKIP